MSDGSSFKKIWIEIKRLDLHENHLFPKNVCLVEINENEGSEEINRKLRETFHIEEPDLVLKLRNHRKSLIPINSNIAANSKSVPYKLEVVRKYQNVTPIPRTLESPAQKEIAIVKKKYIELVSRIEKLEANLPELDKKRQNRIISEVEILQQKLDFLNKRLNEADQLKWKGMFKKNPLW